MVIVIGPEYDVRSLAMPDFAQSSANQIKNGGDGVRVVAAHRFSVPGYFAIASSSLSLKRTLRMYGSSPSAQCP